MASPTPPAGSIMCALAACSVLGSRLTSTVPAAVVWVGSSSGIVAVAEALASGPNTLGWSIVCAIATCSVFGSRPRRPPAAIIVRVMVFRMLLLLVSVLHFSCSVEPGDLVGQASMILWSILYNVTVLLSLFFGLFSIFDIISCLVCFLCR